MGPRVVYCGVVRGQMMGTYHREALVKGGGVS